jgi:hypothetical protein
MNDFLTKVFPSRIGRLEFGIRLAIIIGVWFAVAVSGIGAFKKGWASAVPELVVVIPLGAFHFGGAVLPRVRDTGLHWAFSLISMAGPIVPLFLIVLLIIPTDAFVKSPTGG